MKNILFLILVVVFLNAKESFIEFGNSNKHAAKHLNINKIIKQHGIKINALVKKSEENRWLINNNIKTLENIKNNTKKISQISSSLESIKDALNTIKDKKSITKVIMPKDTNNVKKMQEIEKLEIEVESLMKRVSIIDKALKEQQSFTKTEPTSTLFNFFEYYVIATVVLFLIMFILIFLLSSKTRILQNRLEEMEILDSKHKESKE